MTTVEPRVAAFRSVYAADAVGADLPDVSGLRGKARRLALGVWEHRQSLDEELAAAARGWRLERMPAVDRNVLRLGLYELRHTATPVAVVISEAVEIAKIHSTERSGAFVNGVLGKLAESGAGAISSPEDGR